jgi:hypothetical protein
VRAGVGVAGCAARVTEKAATTATEAAIELYESNNRDRQTVRAAVQGSLRTKTGRGSPDRKE